MLNRNPWSRRELLTVCAMPFVAAAQVEEGFELLFNGRDLTGWEGDSLLWLVDDGMLFGRSPGIGYNDFLATEKSYSDFVLRLQVHLIGDVGNSGVQFRSQRVTGSMEMIGYQADIGPTWWGGLYDESRRRRILVEQDANLINKTVRPDDWNDYEIEARGKQIRLTLNGVTTADYEETEEGIATEGRIALQVHSGPALEVRFRNIRLQQL